MKIIISPAKKMNVDTDSFAYADYPCFIKESEKILGILKEMSEEELQKLWKCNDSLAKLNYDRIGNMNLYENLTPAIFSYEGIQFKHMAPHIFEQSQLDFIQEHLYILSGFYGILKPFDGVTPYRLEMQSKLPFESYKNINAFWSEKLKNHLETDFVLNLASTEYSKVILPYLPEKTKHLTCTFGELKNEKIIEKGTLCKMARGEMVRFLAVNQITSVEEIRNFSQLNFQYAEEHSDESHLVFLQREEKNNHEF